MGLEEGGLKGRQRRMINDGDIGNACMYIYISIYVYNCIYIYIHISIYRYTCQFSIHICVYIYIYMRDSSPSIDTVTL